MNTGHFGIQIIAQGAYIDKPDDRTFLIETMVIRLNPDALEDWHNAQGYNGRECFDTQEEWEAYEAKNAAKLKDWEDKVLALIGIERATRGGITITRAISELFTVICFLEIE